ncbi:hypothetical protein, partial [Caldithrix abyssi]
KNLCALWCFYALLDYYLKKSPALKKVDKYDLINYFVSEQSLTELFEQEGGCSDDSRSLKFSGRILSSGKDLLVKANQINDYT